MMRVINFQIERDLERLEAYLRDRYFERLHANSWLPERLHDIIYRVGAQETDDGREKSADYIYLWEDNQEIIACILPDGENIYISIKDGYEQIFPSMLTFSEKNCRPLFANGEDGSVKFWFAVSDSFTYMQRELTKAGYREYPEKEFTSCVCPLNTDAGVELPGDFRFLYGESCPDEENKWSALRLGFHPEYEAQNYRASMNPYRNRKKSSLYADSFECIVVDEKAAEKNNVCAYCFVYVDQRTKTALVEPVSTREKYRHKGIGTAIMHGAIMRCKQLGVEKCYVGSFGWRKDFYTSAGFFTEDSCSFWYKTLK